MREVASGDGVKVGWERDTTSFFTLCIAYVFVCVCFCVCTVCVLCERVRLIADMFVFIDSKRRAVAAYTAVYEWQGSRLGGNVCV